MLENLPGVPKFVAHKIRYSSFGKINAIVEKPVWTFHYYKTLPLSLVLANHIHLKS